MNPKMASGVGLSPPSVPGLVPVTLSLRSQEAGEEGAPISPRSSALLEEKEGLLAAAKKVDEEFRQSEAQAREQQAVANIISLELREKAKTPRATRSSPSVRPGDTQPQPQMPAQQSAGQQPVIQRAIPQRVHLDNVQMNVAQSQEAGVRAQTPVRNLHVTGRTGMAAAPAAQVLDQQVRTPRAARASSDSADNSRLLPRSSAVFRRGRGVSAAGVSKLTRESSGLTMDGSEDEDDEGWAQLGAGSTESEAAQRDVGMQSLLETESQALLIMQFSDNGTSIMRTDLTRTDLLEVCRNDIDPYRTQGARNLSKNTSFGQLAELNREQPTAEHKPSSASDSHSAAANSLANLHLRDLRYLQGVNDHHLMPRRGAVVVSLGLMNVVITHRNAYFVVPDGADKLLQPLLSRLQTSHSNTESEMPFELRVLEAVLLTLITHHSEYVERCLAEKAAISEGIRSRMGSDMLTKIWKLKRIVTQVIEDIKGCERAVDEVQEDDEALALMYMSAMHENPEEYMVLLEQQVGNTEHVQLLLDAYTLEFHALISQLHLVQKEIEATEDLLTLQLDVARNNLWKVDILVGMASMWISVAVLVSGIFGMNLYQRWSEEPVGPFTPKHNTTKIVGENPSWAFFEVTVISGGGAIGLILTTTFLLWAKGYLVS